MCRRNFQFCSGCWFSFSVWLFVAILKWIRLTIQKLKFYFLPCLWKSKEGGTYRIVYHKENKVMYAVSSSGYNAGNFTLLVDENGDPMLYEGE